MSKARTLADIVAAGSPLVDGTIETTDITNVTSSATELNYTDGVTSNIQTQLDTKAPTASPTFTGTVTADGLTLDNNGTIQFNDPQATDTILIGTNDNELILRTDDGEIALKTNENKQQLRVFNNGDISFYEDTGSTPKFFWDASAESLGIGTSSPSANLTVGSPSASAVSFVSNPVASFGGGIAFDAGSGNAVQLINYRTSNMQFGNGGSVDMTIDSSGNLLVGTTSGSDPLTVSGVTLSDAVQEGYTSLSGTTPSIDADTAGSFALTTSGNTTFTFASVTSGRSVGFVLKLTAGGSHTITWPSSVDWAGGTAPDAPASGETDVLVFYTVDGGTTWYGALSIDAAA